MFQENEKLKQMIHGFKDQSTQEYSKKAQLEILDLKNQIARLKKQLSTEVNISCAGSGGQDLQDKKDNAIDPVAFENLRKTNERLLQEIIRLNSQVKNQTFNESYVSNNASYLN